MSGDWRTGEPAIRYARCDTCGQAWYLVRNGCPRCGGHGVTSLVSSGAGVVAAVTRVERAPSAEWRALLPYSLVLVDVAEGFRMMAHAEADVDLGDAVMAGFRRCGDALLPTFARVRP